MYTITFNYAFASALFPLPITEYFLHPPISYTHFAQGLYSISQQIQ